MKAVKLFKLTVAIRESKVNFKLGVWGGETGVYFTLAFLGSLGVWGQTKHIPLLWHCYKISAFLNKCQIHN